MRIEIFLTQSPIFQAGRAARRMESSLNALLRGEEVTVLEALVLAALFFERRTEIQPSALAVAFQTTRANISHCLSSLEAKGLLQRRLDAKDARAVRITLRPQGRKRAVRVAAILDRLQSRLEDGIGQAKLQATLDQLAAIEDLCTRLTAR
jgi:DNA-binding MarR family transcriptional regulator